MKGQKKPVASTVRDMTQGNPLRQILGFALPMLLGILFQQFYSMVDTVIVGKFLGVEALASVGSTAAINFMINGFVIGVTAGFAIPVAQRFGARDYRGMRQYVANTAWLSIAFATVMTVLVGALTWKILVWMRTPETIIQGAYHYIFIIFLGMPVVYLYNVTASIIRALGDSRTPVYFLVFSSLVNIALDYVTIRWLGLGVSGPAIATVISQAASGVLCLIYMRKKYEILRFEEGETAFRVRLCLNLCNMGIPMGLQYSITAIGSVILQSAVNTLGAVAVASVTAGDKINLFCCCVFDALGGTMATYAGQNVGAGKVDRIIQGVKVATILGIIYGVAAFIVLFTFGGYLPLLFVDAGETEVIRQAHMYLSANSLCYFLLVFVNVWRFTIQGMGYSAFAILAGVCEMIARGLVGFVGVPLLGYPAVCFASPLAWLFADCFLIPAFWHCIGKLQRLFAGRSREPV
ncbi:MAG: MATE family efflux transporter [Clostridiales bacterium]|nr:MATE family efflux transporter [Clostridiales bacterium]